MNAQLSCSHLFKVLLSPATTIYLLNRFKTSLWEKRYCHYLQFSRAQRGPVTCPKLHS